MIHAKFVWPRIFPWNGDRNPEQIDRVQDIGGDLALNREKLYEIGRNGVLGYRKGTPSFSYSMRQYEYGSMDFWRALANQEDPASAALDNSITLEDLKSEKSDISAFLTDDNGTFRGTVWFPNLRVNGFSMNIGDPEAIVERNFDLVGEDYKILEGNYFYCEKDTVITAGPAEFTLALLQIPIEYASGDYVLQVLRVRGVDVTKLEEDATSTYDANSWRYDLGSNSVIVQTCITDDIVKVSYSSATPYTVWADNTVDTSFLLAEDCEIWMKKGIAAESKIYKLQSITIDVALERTDKREIGNTEVVQTGVSAKTVTVTLNSLGEDFTLEDILNNDPAYPYIDPRDFPATIQLMVKIFTDSTHDTFKMGYLITTLSPTALGLSQTIEDYMQKTHALESDNLLISDDENEIVFA